jgi:hypothetical protein
MVAYIISHVVFASSYSGKICTKELRNETATIIENGFEKMGSDCSGKRSDWPFYWIYMTYWGYTLIIFSFLYDTIMVILRFIEEKKCLRRKAEGNCDVINPSYKGSHCDIFWIIMCLSSKLLAVFFTITLFFQNVPWN